MTPDCLSSFRDLYRQVNHPRAFSVLCYLINQLPEGTGSISCEKACEDLGISRKIYYEAIKYLKSIQKCSSEWAGRGSKSTLTLSINCHIREVKVSPEVFPEVFQSELKPSTELALVKTKKPSKPPVDPEFVSVGALWLEWAISAMPWKSAPANWTAENFGLHLHKLSLKTDLNPMGLKALLNFIKNDDFWSRNALSPCSLLKQGSNGNRKIDNILLRMKPAENKTANALRSWMEEDEPTVRYGAPF